MGSHPKQPLSIRRVVALLFPSCQRLKQESVSLDRQVEDQTASGKPWAETASFQF